MDEKLADCPFCGNKGCLGEVDGTFYVTCCNCFVEVYPHTILDSHGNTNRWTKEEAIKAWNTRKSQATAGKVDKERILTIVDGFHCGQYGINACVDQICREFAPISNLVEALDVKSVLKFLEEQKNLRGEWFLYELEKVAILFTERFSTTARKNG